MMRKLAKYLRVTIACCLIAIVGICYFYYHTFYEQSLVHTATEIEIPSGKSISHIARRLHKQGVLPHPKSFIFFTKLHRNTRNVHAGEYLLEPDITANEFLQMLVEGRVIMRDFTLVEGWRFSQVLDNMHSNPYLEHNTRAKTDHQIMQSIDEQHQNAEGRFFPESYHFAKGTAESEILEMAYKLMSTHLDKLWSKRVKTVPYKSPYEALIVASLIEKETAIDSERDKIAGVIIRRLKKHMALQIDPTVIYGLGKHYTGKLSKKDLQNPHAYNTYKFKGLPPTPIAMPGLPSIKAALHPAAGKALYFVAKGDGSHVFSATLEEHQRAVKEFRRKTQQAKG